MGSRLARVALRCVIIVSVDRVEAARDHLRMELSRYKIDSEYLKKGILETDTAIKATSTCLLCIEKNCYNENRERAFVKD